MSNFYILAFAVGLLASLPARLLATSVIPPDFSELVENAESIVRSEVTSVRSGWKGSGETRRIVTWVQLRIERTLVGAPVQQLELEFLGGRVGNDVLRVSGMPTFKVGSRDAAVVATLPPGAYTALVSGKNDTSGVALVEVYEIVD